MFQTNDALKDAVAQKDKPTIQHAIISYMNIDPYSLRGEVTAAMEYVQAHEIDPFDLHDSNIALKEDPSAWDKDYLAHVTATMYRNFSKERYAHWLAVSKKIGEQQREEQAKSQPRQSSSAASSSPARPHVEKSKQGEINPLAVVGVAAAVVVGAAIIIAIAK